MTIQMDMIQSLALAVIMLLIGKQLRSKVKFFEKYCIPSPVIGGIIFSVIALILRQSGTLMFEFDDTLQKFFMTMFFTTIGFNASLRVLKKGGPKVLLFLGVATGLAILQNVVAAGLSGVVGLEPLLALMTGSTPMTGGHGTAGAIAPTVEELGVIGANTVGLAAATFGLVSGSMMGGPLANRLIIKHDLVRKRDESVSEQLDFDSSLLEEETVTLDVGRVGMAFFQILIAMGIGTYVSVWLVDTTGLNFPGYIGAMVVAAVITNLSETGIFNTPKEEIGVVGDVALNLFLAMALMTLKLWELADLAGPLIILLIGQVVLVALYATYVTFPIMGKNYDAAVIAAGHCGFGLGATPNGIANMDSVSEKYGYSQMAFFVLPIVGALFIDFVNALNIQLFINFFG
ncbi:MAG: sodium/glutamate symporter [Tissierellaceae bacterium]|jgi:ESS family glutamate:Na+ symporter|nr:sodium/glutamate symporter [Tissierellia bacterium]